MENQQSSGLDSSQEGQQNFIKLDRQISHQLEIDGQLTLQEMKNVRSDEIGCLSKNESMSLIQNIDPNQWEIDQEENEGLIGGQKFIDEILEQLREADGLYQISQMQVIELTDQLQMSKLFLNMVIHDCRNPTSSIKIGLTLIMDRMKDIKEITIHQVQFGEMCNEYTSKLSQSFLKLTQGNRIEKLVQAI